MKKWDNEAASLPPWRVAETFCRSNFPSPLLEIGLRCVEAFRNGDFSRYREIRDELAVREFTDWLEYCRIDQFLALFSKSIVKGCDTRQAALDTFGKGEMACKRVNKRLRYFWSRPERENPIYRVILSRARGLISGILGDFTEHTLEQILDLARYSGGTSIGTTHSTRVSPEWKCCSRATKLAVSDRARPYARMLLEQGPYLREIADVESWCGLSVTYSVRYESANFNRLSVVPKDALKGRTIAVEPHLNQALQLGAGEYIARKLKRVGIDLRDQGRNQRLAKLGAAGWWKCDPLVTLDLSAASDCISIALVERLLPSAWVGFLSDLRSHQYMVGGEIHEYQKWSSMGNGYTFPLESMIFWALGRACSSFLSTEGEVGVYGDDIIVPRSAALLLTEVLRYCGFRLNVDKSHIFGPFRESCGVSMWGTQNVTPIYLRWLDNVRPTDAHRLLNYTVNWYDWSDVASLLHRSFRGRLLTGPKTEDHASHIHVSIAEARKRGLMFRTRVRSKKVRPLGPGLVDDSDEATQSWSFWAARFRSTRETGRAYPRYLAALLSGGSPSEDSRFVLKRRGKWYLSRVRWS